jgi:alpha-galactosidase
MSNPKSRQFLHQIVHRLSHEWGYEYFKMDGLWTGTGTKLKYHDNEYKEDDLGKTLRFDPMITPIEAYRKGMEVVRDAAGDITEVYAEQDKEKAQEAIVKVG